MLKLALLLLIFPLFPSGRRTLRAGWQGITAVWRPTTGLLAVVLLMAAAVLAVREDWLVAAGLAVAGAAVALTARRRAPRPAPAPPLSNDMSPAAARSILGVPEGASREAVEAAYRRLMRMAHPDKGGTAGLAAQLNAARAALRR